MTTISYRALKIKPMIKKRIVTNHTFFTFITSIRVNSFACINFIVIAFIISSLQKDRYQDRIV